MEKSGKDTDGAGGGGSPGKEDQGANPIKSVSGNNTQGTSGGPPQVEENKTPYERFEDNVREIIFNVLYVLLKNEEHSKFDTTIEVALDMFQIYSFTFSQKAAFPWKQEGIMYYWEWCFNIIQIDTLFNYIDYTTFVVIFYVAIMMVILVIIDIFYVSYSFQQKKFKYVWPLKLLRTFCGLLVTVFFLNFLELYANFVKCNSKEGDIPGQTVMDLYSDVECWKGLFILHSSFAVAVSFVFVIICLVAAIALFETKESVNDVCAKVTSRPDFAVLIVKIVILYQYGFFYQPENHWFLIISTFLMSLIIYKGFRDNWPYYSDYMNRLMSLVTGLFLWGNFVLIIVKFLEDSEFNGGLQIYFLGLPLVSLMIVFGKDERVQLLNKNINNFQQGEEMALQIRYFLNLVQTKETDRRNAIILRGYIYHHEDSCSYPDCCLAQYKKLMKQTISAKNNQSSKDGKTSSGSQPPQQKKSNKKEMQKLLLQHAKNMYRAAMRKFPSCTALRIQYAFFLLDHLGKKQEAKAEFIFANQFSPSFEEKFIIFRYLKMMEDYDDVGEGNAGGEEIDVVAKFAYDSSLRQFHESIVAAAQEHHKFWNFLKSDRVDMGELNKCGEEINKEVVNVERFWEQLQKLSPNQPDVMKTYARYLSQVLNDNQSGQELMARAKEATSGKSFLDSESALGFDQSDSPCIMVSGDSDEIGTITQWSKGANRIFGYEAHEIVGKSVELLMPTVYARHHTKVLRNAISRGPEHIPNKERFVFALNKSGYIFPVFIQLKLIQKKEQPTQAEAAAGEEEDEEVGGQFVAIFKIDKKLMSSNIGFLLIDKERKIQAISSSCISMLYLDQHRLKKLNQNGATIDDYSPEIYQNQESGDRQFYPVEWTFESEFDRQNSKESNNSRQKSLRSSEGTLLHLKTLNIPEEKGHFMCSVSSLMMGDMGEVSQCVRLETVTIDYVDDGEGNQVAVATTGTAVLEATNNSPKKQRKQQNFPVPQFQFHFDSHFKRGFIGEILPQGSDQTLNKNLKFLKQKQRIIDQLTNNLLIEDQFSASMAIEESKNDESQEPVSTEEVVLLNGNGNTDDTNRSVDMSQRTPLIPNSKDTSEDDKQKQQASLKGARGAKKLNMMEIHQMMQRKKDWSKNISTYQLINGLFRPKISEEELLRQQELEEQKRLQEEMEEDSVVSMTGFESFSGNLNSKKALQNSLKDRRPISSITRLKYVMNFAIICLITLAAVDYSVIGSNFSEINENFNLIQKSFGRVSEFQRVGYDLRALIMINEGLLNQTQANYIRTTNASLDLKNFLRNDLTQALAQLYEYQSALSLSPLSLSSGQSKLFYEKTVPLYFKDQGETIKTLKFTINEAVLQLLSAIFSSKHLNFTDFKESNEDLHFININIYNDMLVALRQTSEYYVEELLARADGELKSIIVLFIISTITLLLTLAILFPVVRSVSSARLKILTLFVDIPYSIAFSLSTKCQKFIEAEKDQGKDQANSEGASGNGGGAAADDLLNNDHGTQGNDDQQQDKKKSKQRARVPIFESAMKDNKFFTQFGFAILFLLGYFIGMLVISLQYTTRIKLITNEMNLMSQAESYYEFAQNVQKELIYDKKSQVLGSDSFQIAKDSLEEIYIFNEYFLNEHFENRANLNEKYVTIFDDIFTGDLCTQKSIIKFDQIPFSCDSYQYGKMGLRTILTRYFELLKESMKNYVTLSETLNQTRVAQILVNSPIHRELYILQYRFLGDTLRYMVNQLTSLTNEEFNSTLNIKVIAFVVFVIAICIAYLALWMPFVLKMTKDMWRSKSMLSIIPIEVIIRMPRIYQFLLKQSFSEIKVNPEDQRQAAKGGGHHRHKGQPDQEDYD